MSDSFTGGATGAAWDRLTETAYDQVAAFYLRDEPQWWNMIDKRPAAQAMPGDVVTLTIHKALSNAVTPLTETVDVSAVAATAPDRVSVTISEYGNAALTTLRLRELAFTKPQREIAELIGRNMQDSVDEIVRTVADGSTNILFVNGTAMKGSDGDFDSIVAGDNLTRNPATAAVKILRRSKVMPKVNNRYLALIAPDASFDLQAENSATAWTAPHVYGGDTDAIYTGTIGDFQGARYVETTRITSAVNAAGTPQTVFNTYYFGREALVKAVAEDPHIVIGPQTDHLRRFFPIGWYAMFGVALYRPEALVIAQTTSSIGALSLT